jgi:uncharacterized membrane protein
MDDELKKYFSYRASLPPGVKAETFAKLKQAEANEARTPSLWIWSVVAFDFLISVSVLFVLWVLFGHGLIVYAVTMFVGMSLFAAVVVATVRSAEGGAACSGL